MTYDKFTASENFNELNPTELLIAYEVIHLQIAELKKLWTEMNDEQTRIMQRYHEIEPANESEGEQS